MNNEPTTDERQKLIAAAADSYTAPPPQSHTVLMPIRESLATLRRKGASYRTIAHILREANIEVSLDTLSRYLQYFLTPDIAQVFCPTENTFDFSDIDQGKIICIAMPQKYQTERRYVNTFLKMLFYKVFDPQFNQHNFLIHDYFFAKSLEKARPGGLIAFITSMGTMDKQDARLRDYLHERAELVGAVRLPNTAFRQNANTEVTTDMVFLRRLHEGEAPCGPDWRELAEHQNADGVSFRINRYFAEHPGMMCGRMASEGTMYSEGEPALVPDGRPLDAALSQAIAHLPSDIYRHVESQSENQGDPKEIPAPDGVKEGAFTLHEGQVAVRKGGTHAPPLASNCEPSVAFLEMTENKSVAKKSKLTEYH